MPSLTIPDAPKYTPPSPTQERLEYADLEIIDLSQIGTPEGRAGLVEQVRKAMTTQGFFYVINHGYTSAQKDRIFDIADLTFTAVSPEEKQLHTAKGIDTYDGYKPRQFWRIEPGVHDQVEHYNMNCDVSKRMHPGPLRPFVPEMQAFSNHNHYNVLYPLLRLLALGLELPEDTLTKQHDFDADGETSHEEQKTKNVWLKGHTDTGSVSILWSQPIAALQILSPDGKWRWLQHRENALVINIGDALEFLSGGYYKATIHRVVQPPADQRDYDRVGVFYFAKPNDDIKLVPYVDSPVLQKVGVERRIDDADAPTMEQWRKGRAASYGRTDLKKTDKGTEEEYINGVLVKHYN
ncbi:hypothetical protein PLICRDRAFT_173418 [Plicaturopsis crispa FD-325 SS-3]|nr:hypothetical protein PLICRDRAFT_173418 [Plicaturopsis crispa FD-325 SS-3]